MRALATPGTLLTAAGLLALSGTTRTPNAREDAMNRSTLALRSGVFAVGQSWVDGPGTTNANFLKVAQGVRPAARSGAYAGLAEGLDTLTWNPAGLAALKNPAAEFLHTAVIPPDLGLNGFLC